MPTVFTHAFIGVAIASPWISRVEGKREKWTLGVTAAVLPVIPDADTFLMNWIPYGAPLGHRGFTHSLFFACLLGLIFVLLLLDLRRIFPGKVLGLFLLLFFITASHGVLDAFVDVQYGVAFFSPFDNTRYLFPATPIPAAYITIDPGDMLDKYGIQVLITELLLLWTIGAGIILLSFKKFKYRYIPSALLIAGGLIYWIIKCI